MTDWLEAWKGLVVYTLSSKFNCTLKEASTALEEVLDVYDSTNITQQSSLAVILDTEQRLIDSFD